MIDAIMTLLSVLLVFIAPINFLILWDLKRKRAEYRALKIRCAQQQETLERLMSKDRRNDANL